MTDYKAEQKDEIECLESIYSEEIDMITVEPEKWRCPLQ